MQLLIYIIFLLVMGGVGIFGSIKKVNRSQIRGAQLGEKAGLTGIDGLTRDERKRGVVASSYQAQHLCEEGSVHDRMLDSYGYGKDNLVDSTDTIDSYSMSQLGLRREHARRLSREEFENKQEELESLLHAGIISREEYNLTLNEYRIYSE